MITNPGFEPIINHIFEYAEGNTLTFEKKETPRYSNLRLVNKLWNKIILDRWDIRYLTYEIIDQQIYNIEFILECGGCNGCMCFHQETSGGENQIAHYGGCMADECESEDEFEERINNLSIGGVKYQDYQDRKRKREEDLYEGKISKKACLLY